MGASTCTLWPTWSGMSAPGSTSTGVPPQLCFAFYHLNYTINQNYIGKVWVFTSTDAIFRAQEKQKKTLTLLYKLKLAKSILPPELKLVATSTTPLQGSNNMLVGCGSHTFVAWPFSTSIIVCLPGTSLLSRILLSQTRVCCPVCASGLKHLFIGRTLEKVNSPGHFDLAQTRALLDVDQICGCQRIPPSPPYLHWEVELVRNSNSVARQIVKNGLCGGYFRQQAWSFDGIGTLVQEVFSVGKYDHEPPGRNLRTRQQFIFRQSRSVQMLNYRVRYRIVRLLWRPLQGLATILARNVEDE